jgi:hypothetical protein
MSSKGKSLKEQNAWLVRAALILHALAFAYVVLKPFPLSQFVDESFWKHVQEFLAPGSISLGILALTRLLLLGLIPPQLRDRLVHWRWRHPLPGSRAFTKIGPADQRVDMKKLRKALGGLPTNPDKQSSLFYAIYKQHQNEVGVLDAHKSYLAARDIATLTFLICVLLPPIAGWFLEDYKRAAFYALATLVAYAVTCLAAQVYAKRMIQNVLAVASHSTYGNALIGVERISEA